jgi:poly-gamma-glutamate synthesis protein (capsule biosynthesis protein)
MINITISGDFAPNNLLLDSVSKLNNNYFDKLKPLLQGSDLNIANLEAPVIEKPSPSAKYGPSLSTENRAIDLLKKGNFQLVTLANNHIMDHGSQGLFSTLEKIKIQNIQYLGAGKNVEEANKPFIYKKNGMLIGILNFAENEFSNTIDENPGAAALDLIDNSNAIKNLKNEVDFVIVIIHGGAELHEYPSPRFKKTLRFMAEQGSDLVVGHHTHRYNGYEVYKEVPIFYGLGNFIFPSQTLNDKKWSLGVLLNLQIKFDKSVQFETIPFLQNFKNFSIKVLEGDELAKFRKDEMEMNDIILNEKALSEKYELFFKNVENQYLHYLQPYTSKYLHKLYSMGVLPSFLQSKAKKLLYLNLIRCEAHRDIILKVLK